MEKTKALIPFVLFAICYSAFHTACPTPTPALDATPDAPEKSIEDNAVLVHISTALLIIVLVVAIPREEHPRFRMLCSTFGQLGAMGRVFFDLELMNQTGSCHHYHYIFWWPMLTMVPFMVALHMWMYVTLEMDFRRLFGHLSGSPGKRYAANMCMVILRNVPIILMTKQMLRLTDALKVMGGDTWAEFVLIALTGALDGLAFWSNDLPLAIYMSFVCHSMPGHTPILVLSYLITLKTLVQLLRGRGRFVQKTAIWS